MENVYLNQQIDRLRKLGYFGIANPDFAREIMAALPRPEFKDVRYVDGTGRFAVEGFVFLPSARRFIISKVKHDLREAEKCATSYRRALTELKR